MGGGKQIIRRNCMSNFINAIVGDTKNAKPTRRYTAYALLGTLAAFLLAVIVLIASSVFFAVKGGETPDAGGENAGGEGGAVINTSSISYETVTADALDGKKGDLELLKSYRTELSGGVYYGIKPRDDLKLESSAANALNSMLVSFYNAKKDSLIVDIDAEKCDIPLVAVGSNSDGYSFKIVRYYDEASLDTNTYKWIFDNAYKYGFVYENNTFTYVGVAVSNYIKVNSSVSNYTQFLNVIRSASNNISTSAKDVSTNKSVNYQMYYLSADAAELKLPTNYEYTVIPDGTGGYVITVNMSAPIIDGVG